MALRDQMEEAIAESKRQHEVFISRAIAAGFTTEQAEFLFHIVKDLKTRIAFI